jgi:hypothetical protein
MKNLLLIITICAGSAFGSDNKTIGSVYYDYIENLEVGEQWQTVGMNEAFLKDGEPCSLYQKNNFEVLLITKKYLYLKQTLIEQFKSEAIVDCRSSRNRVAVIKMTKGAGEYNTLLQPALSSMADFNFQDSFEELEYEDEQYSLEYSVNDIPRKLTLDFIINKGLFFKLEGTSYEQEESFTSLFQYGDGNLDDVTEECFIWEDTPGGTTETCSPVEYSDHNILNELRHS